MSKVSATSKPGAAKATGATASKKPTISKPGAAKPTGATASKVSATSKPGGAKATGATASKVTSTKPGAAKATAAKTTTPADPLSGLLGMCPFVVDIANNFVVLNTKRRSHWRRRRRFRPFIFFNRGFRW